MTAVAVVTPSSGSNSAAVLLFWVVGADTCPSLVVARGPRGRRALSSLWRSPPTDPVRPVFDRSAREGNAPRKGAGCPGATTEDRTVMRTTAGRRLSCGGCRTREGTVRADGPLVVLAAQTEPLNERAVAADVGLRQVVQQAAAPPDQQEQAPPAVVVVLVLLEVLGEVADPAGQHRDLDLRRTGVVLDRRVVGHDLLLDSALERHRAASWPGHVWPPVWFTRAACTHVGFADVTSHGTSGAISAFRPGSLRRRDVEQGPGADEVVVHRRDQGGHVGEGHHPAQPGGELDAHVLAVEVAVEVEDERLDTAPAALERGVGADRDRGGGALLADPAARGAQHQVPGVDAVGGDRRVRRALHVRRRVAQRAAAAV